MTQISYDWKKIKTSFEKRFSRLKELEGLQHQLRTQTGTLTTKLNSRDKIAYNEYEAEKQQLKRIIGG